MRRLFLCLLSAGLLLGACSDDDDGGSAAITSLPDETTTTTSSTTTEPPTPPPDVIPSDPSLITEDYVEQVLNKLFEASNEALRMTMEAGLVDERAIRVVEATSAPFAVADDLNSLDELARQGFPNVKAEPAPLRADVRTLHERRVDCVLAEAEVDRGGVVVTAAEDAEGTRTFISLVPATEEQLASGLNATAWATTTMTSTTDGSVPEPDCAG